MSKMKNAKKKYGTPVTDSKMTGIKADPNVGKSAGTEIAARSVTPQSETSSNKIFAVKYEGASCYESAVNCNLGKESCADGLSDFMKNAILEEVLNEKKAALLQSPAIKKLLHDEQLKKQKK